MNDEDRTWGLAAHATALIGALAGGAPAFLGPLIILLARGDRAFVRAHAAEALNFQLSLLIYATAAVLLALLTLGIGLFVIIPAWIGILVVGTVFLVQGMLAARDGRTYHYPLSLPLVR